MWECIQVITAKQTGSENVGRKAAFTCNGVDTDCTDNRDWLIWASIG